MSTTQKLEKKPMEVIIKFDNGKSAQIDVTLPIQMLFDDFMNFVSQM